MTDTQEKWVEEFHRVCTPYFGFITEEDSLERVDVFFEPFKFQNELRDFIRKTREEAKREIFQELKKDVSDHLESSENLDICNFWIDVRDWLVIKQSDSLTSKQEEETV